MSKRIWKETVPIGTRTNLGLPKNSQIVEVACGNSDHVDFWFEFNDPMVNQLEERQFTIIGTGMPAEHHWTHRGTARSHDGLGLVWHLYELPT